MGAVDHEGQYVLYWMTMQRRPHFNFALQRAVEWALKLSKPLVILEALRCDYRWASQRIHRFVMQGMQDHLEHFHSGPALYYPYVERGLGQGKGLVRALSQKACLVVTDEFPCYFLPRMLAAAASQIRASLEIVDGNGLLPLRAPGRAFERAVDLRRFLQKSLYEHLQDLPVRDPLAEITLPSYLLPQEVLQRWPRADAPFLAGSLSGLPIGPLAPVDYRGGFRAAQDRIGDFLSQGLAHYSLDRNRPGSGLSPYLHFGHTSVFALLDSLARLEQWTPAHMTIKASGRKGQTWGMSEPAEAFLDQVVTWRELGYLYAHYRSDYESYDSLPTWALRTLEEHAGDRRDHLYTPIELEEARTHDDIWNAAQRQLRGEGRIHNYLRMLWGKKVLEWSRHPREALDILIELNNKYALDGRNPNSYSGIFWCLGRFDRPWPTRPIFGSVRYMSSQSTRAKLKLDSYLARWGPPTAR